MEIHFIWSAKSQRLKNTEANQLNTVERDAATSRSPDEKRSFFNVYVLIRQSRRGVSHIGRDFGKCVRLQGRTEILRLGCFISFLLIFLSLCAVSHTEPLLSSFPFYSLTFSSQCLILAHLLPPRMGKNKTEPCAIDIKGGIRGLDITGDDFLSNSRQKGEQMKNGCTYRLKKKKKKVER